LKSVREVAGKEIKGNTSDSIMVKFSQKNVMVDGVEGLRKIKKYSNSVMVLVKGRGNFIIDV
jgi:hypothetical protein